MHLDYVPLLQVQRDLYRLPRGMGRFREYIKTMVDPETGDLALPLPAMNPMGKDHVPIFLDALLAFDADTVAAGAVAEACAAVHHDSGVFKLCLVVSDDLKGGWTNRYAAEFGYRFEQRALYRRGWIAGLLWTSEVYDASRVRDELRQCVFRAAYVQRHGQATTLAQMLAQEAFALHHAGSTEPTIDADDLDYTREVLAAHLAKTDRGTLIAAIFGDPAAHQLGYPPLGLTHRAGLALALASRERVTAL
jgi:hypothetical protein